MKGVNNQESNPKEDQFKPVPMFTLGNDQPSDSTKQMLISPEFPKSLKMPVEKAEEVKVKRDRSVSADEEVRLPVTQGFTSVWLRPPKDKKVLHDISPVRSVSPVVRVPSAQ